MDQEKLIQASPPSIYSLLYANPTIKNSTKTIEKTTIDEFLYLSRVYLGLDKNS
jgi:hypothetical protein